MSVCQVRNTRVKRDTSSVKDDTGTGIPNALLPISLAFVFYPSVFLSLFESFWKGLELDQLPWRLQMFNLIGRTTVTSLQEPITRLLALNSPTINWWTISGFKRREERERESRIGSIF